MSSVHKCITHINSSNSHSQQTTKLVFLILPFYRLDLNLRDLPKVTQALMAGALIHVRQSPIQTSMWVVLIVEDPQLSHFRKKFFPSLSILFFPMIFSSRFKDTNVHIISLMCNIRISCPPCNCHPDVLSSDNLCDYLNYLFHMTDLIFNRNPFFSLSSDVCLLIL